MHTIQYSPCRNLEVSRVLGDHQDKGTFKLEEKGQAPRPNKWRKTCPQEEMEVVPFSKVMKQDEVESPPPKVMKPGSKKRKKGEEVDEWADFVSPLDGDEESTMWQRYEAEQWSPELQDVAVGPPELDGQQAAGLEVPLQEENGAVHWGDGAVGDFFRGGFFGGGEEEELEEVWIDGLDETGREFVLSLAMCALSLYLRSALSLYWTPPLD